MPKSWTSRKIPFGGVFQHRKTIRLFNAFGYAFGYTKMWSLSTIFSDHYPNGVKPRVKSTSFRSCLPQGVFFLGCYIHQSRNSRNPQISVILTSPDIQWCLSWSPKNLVGSAILKLFEVPQRRRFQGDAPAQWCLLKPKTPSWISCFPVLRHRHGTEAGAWKSSAAGKCLAMAETWTLNLEIVTIV